MSRSAPPRPPTSTGGDAPEGEPGEKYLTLVEHLQELRYRLTVSAVAVVVGVAISFYFSGSLIDFLAQPARDRAANFQLQFIEPLEKFATYFKVSMLGGLVLAMPVATYHLLRFVTPGLRPAERRWVYLTTAGAAALFLAGIAFGYYVALPPALDFLLNFGDRDLAQPNIRIGSYIDFVVRLVFWIGVAFETPIVVMFLARFRIVSARQLLHWWRYAIVLAFIIAAVVTPTWDPVTQSLVAAPIIVLYFAGVVLAAIVQPRPSP